MVIKTVSKSCFLESFFWGRRKQKCTVVLTHIKCVLKPPHNSNKTPEKRESPVEIQIGITRGQVNCDVPGKEDIKKNVFFLLIHDARWLIYYNARLHVQRNQLIKQVGIKRGRLYLSCGAGDREGPLLELWSEPSCLAPWNTGGSRLIRMRRIEIQPELLV